MTSVYGRVRGDDPGRTHDLSLAPAALAVWLAGMGGLWFGWWFAPLAGTGAVLGGLWWLRVFPRSRPPRHGYVHLTRAGAWVLLGCGPVIAVSLGTRLFAADTDPLRAAAAAGSTATVVAEVTERPRPVHSDGFAGTPAGARSVVVRVQVRQAGVAGEVVPSSGQMVLIAPAEQWSGLLPQQEVTATAELAPARSGELTVAAGFPRGPPRSVTPAPWWQRAAAAMRDDLRSACRVLDDEPAGLLPGLVVGDTGNLPQRVETELRASGLSHLIAVSGANVAIVCGAVLLALRAVRIGPRTAAGLAGLTLLGYVILVGPEPSVLRAAAMGAVSLLALALGKARSAVPALSFAVLVLVLGDPGMAVNVGFALSVLATAGLVLIAPLWSDRLSGHGIPRGIAEALAIPAVAHLVTAPVIAGMAGKLSLVAVAANLLVAPVIAPATVLGVLAAALAPASSVPAGILAWLAGPEVSWVITVGRQAAAMPGAVLPWPSGWWGGLGLGAVALAILLLLRYRRLRALLVSALLGLMLVLVPMRETLAGWPPSGWSMVACDVGQGDGLVLATGTRGRAVVVDVGPDPAAMDRCLSTLGISRIPLVILSHLHADHIGGLAAVLGGREVGAVAVGPGRSPAWAWQQVRGQAAEARVPLVRVRSDIRLRWPGLRLDVLGPLAPVPQELAGGAERKTNRPESGGPEPDGAGVDGTAVNNTSVVLRAHTAAGRVLLTGDAELAAQADLLASGQDLSAEVLKVAHHGSRYSVPELIDAVRPRVAVISVGADNDYGHPSPAILTGLAERGVLVARTDQGGDTAIVRSGPGQDRPQEDTPGDVDRAGVAVVRRGAARRGGLHPWVSRPVLPARQRPTGTPWPSGRRARKPHPGS